MPATAPPPTADVQPFRYWETPIVPGRTLVEASAGTGKTFAIAGLVLRLVLDGDVLAERPGGLPDLRRLLVVTFTKAATEELKNRIRAALRVALRAARGAEVAKADAPLVAPLAPLLERPEAEARVLAALDRVDEAGVYTIHGFCQRVLRQAAFESGTPFDLDFIEEGDTAALLRRAAADAWGRLIHHEDDLAALAVRNGWTPDALLEHYQATSAFRRVRFLPETPPLDDALATLREAAADVREAWNAGYLTGMATVIKWNKTAPFDHASLPGLIERVAEIGDDPDAIALALHFAPDKLEDVANKRGKDNRAMLAELVEHPAIQACGRLADAAHDLRFSLLRDFVAEVDGRAEAIKKRRGLVGFDDLIFRLHDALHADATGDALAQTIQQQFAVALIDEFQDTDQEQYALFRRAFEGRPLFFVGDPKQAIYGFRGADIHTYLRAQQEADRVFTLGTNWRSAPQLIGAVNALFGVPERPFLFEGIPFRPVAAPDGKAAKLAGDGLPPLVTWLLPQDDTGGKVAKGQARRDVVVALVAEIQRLLGDEVRLGERPLEAGDVAVLVPTHFEARMVQQALQAVGLPSVVNRSGDIRDSQEMADVELLLNAVARPDETGALRAALATELWGWSAAQIAELDDAPSEGQASELDPIRDRLRTWQRLWRTKGVLHVLAAFIQQQHVTERLLAYRDGERRMTNLRHAVELLHEAEQGKRRSPEDLLHWLRHRHEQQLSSKDKSELRLESDARAVQIVTQHSAKGLEFEVVFLPFLWSVRQGDTQTPSEVLARTADGYAYDLGSPDFGNYLGRQRAEEMAERLRLTYVALTRARERCYVTWGHVNMGHYSALGYLLGGHGADLAEGDLARHVEDAIKRAAAESGRDPSGTLRTLADAHPDCLCVLDLPAPPAASGSSTSSTAEAPASMLQARTLPPEAKERVRHPWRQASFSAWAAAGDDADEPTDADDRSDEPSTDALPHAEEEDEQGLHAFARGPAAGQCLHELLEKVDFRDPDAESFDTRNKEAIRRTLRKHGLHKPRAHRAPIDPFDEALGLVRRIAAARLPGEAAGAFRLADTDARSRFVEWRFVSPLGRVAPSSLAEVFRQHAQDDLQHDYADALAALRDQEIDGYLVGFADLVVLHEGRWWLLDWKSNHLGANHTAYASEALRRTMADHHYWLQLHLYTVGLHRYLRARLGADYDYEQHVGGGLYVFLRGVQDGTPGSGLVHERPPRALIEALDALLQGA